MKAMENSSGFGDSSNQPSDWAHRFQEIVETGDVAARLKPRYNLKEPKDGIKFKLFIYDSVERYQKKKFVMNQHSKLANCDSHLVSLKDQQMKSFLAK